MMDFKEHIGDLIERRQLIWYGHVHRMGEEQLLKSALLRMLLNKKTREAENKQHMETVNVDYKKLKWKGK